MSRRIGRSQNGMAGGSSWPCPLDAWPAEPAGSAGGVGGGVGLGPAADRPRTGLAPAAGHPLAGQAGPPELDPPWPEPPPVMGGAEPRPLERAWLLTGPEGAGTAGVAARGRGLAPGVGRGLAPGAGLALGPAERPAPRDQPEAEPTAPATPFDPLPVRGGRSRGGATRAPLSASVTFLARADPAALAPLTARREPELTSASPSAGGGASGRSREAYASPVPVPVPVPAVAAVAAASAGPAVPAATPAADPAAIAAAWPGFRRAHRAAR